MQKKNLVIFSGANKLINDSKLNSHLIVIANNLDLNKYNVWYGGGNAGIMGVIPKHFHLRGRSFFS